MICDLKKAKGGFFLGMGIGILAVMFMPLNLWLILISLALIALGIKNIFTKRNKCQFPHNLIKSKRR